MRSIRFVGAFACASILAAPQAFADASARDHCRAAKLQAIADYTSCRLHAERKLVLRGDIGRFDAALAACDATLTGDWQGAVDRAARRDTECADAPRPLADYRAVISTHTDALSSALAGNTLLLCGNGVVDAGEECDRADLDRSTCASEGFAGGALSCGVDCTLDTGACFAERFVDNRDGTITDLETRLMWEKKVGLDGSFDADDLAWPHDADTVIAWAARCDQVCQPGAAAGAACAAATGPGFPGCSPCPEDCRPRSSLPGAPTAWQWIVALNDARFAGRSDWRLPTREELDSLLTFGRQTAPGVAAALHGRSCGPDCTDLGDPDCACTGTRYWTGSVATEPGESVWTVDFGDTSITRTEATTAAASVRAVRHLD
jgi:hypothetical protein